MTAEGSATVPAVETPELTILVPIYNERPTVLQVVDRLLALTFPVSSFEVVLVDDGSTDGTRELLEERNWPANVRVTLHPRNRGKGAAIRTGIDVAAGRFVAIADADLELDVADLVDVVRPLAAGETDAAFGTRIFERSTPRKFRYWLGNRGVTMAMNLAFRSRMTDIMTAFKAVRTDILRAVPLVEEGFGIEPEITAALLARGVSIVEVPVHYEPRARVDGKKLTMLDGFRVLRTIARCRSSAASYRKPVQSTERALERTP